MVVVGRSLLRGNLTVKVAPPGVGKSTLCLERAVAVITGRTITGEEVHEHAKVCDLQQRRRQRRAEATARRRPAALEHPPR